jgi:competence protein ComFC
MHFFKSCCLVCNDWIKRGNALCSQCTHYCISYDENKSRSILFDEHLDDSFALLKYEKCQNLIFKIKRSYDEYSCFKIAELIFQYFEKQLADCDIIIPIPMHWTNKIFRGFNQALIFAEALGAVFCIPIEKNILYKKHKTKKQHKTSYQERLENIKNCFGIKDEMLPRIENKKILLVDDVLTTGATSNECAKVLKSLNAKTIKLVAIART